MNYAFEVQSCIANLGEQMDSDELMEARNELNIGYVSDVPATDRLKVATDWLLGLVKDGADYTLQRQVVAARITADADVKTTTVYMRAVRDSLNTADVTLEQHGREFTFVCPWETDDATVNEWANKIKQMLKPLKGIACVQTALETVFDEMPDFATVRFPADFKTRFFHGRFVKFKEAIEDLTVDGFADEQMMWEVTNLISAPGDDIVWYEDRPMPLSKFVRRLNGETKLFVNLSYVAGIH